MTLPVGPQWAAVLIMAAMIMDLAFTAMGGVPENDAEVRAHITHVSLDYTFWLNRLSGAPAAYLFCPNSKNPMIHDHAGHGHEHQHGVTAAGHDHAAHHAG